MSHPRYRVLDRRVTRFNAVVVEQTGKRIDLAVAGASFATWHPDHYLTGYSWDAITAACLLHPSTSPKRILLLGLAGGTVARQLRKLLPHADLESVEIDPDLVELGNRYMQLRETAVQVHLDDAYAFLHTTKQRYDVIADDVYLTGYDDVERPRMPGEKWLGGIRNRLSEGGIAIANFVTGDHHDAIYGKARRHFREAFSTVRVVAPPRGYNRILVGGDQLASTPSLHRRAEAFGRKRDRELWRRIKVTPLR